MEYDWRYRTNRMPCCGQVEHKHSEINTRTEKTNLEMTDGISDPATEHKTMKAQGRKGYTFSTKSDWSTRLETVHRDKIR